VADVNHIVLEASNEAGLGGDIYYHMLGGICERPTDVRPTVNVDPGMIRATAAMWLLGSRAVGGRTHRPFDHYGALVVHLNGRIIQLSTTSDPVQVAPGVYFSEAQSKEAVACSTPTTASGRAEPISPISWTSSATP